MINNISPSFQGDKLRLAREMNLLTIAKLGSELKVSHQLVSNWENEKKKPTFDTVLRLSEILNLPRSFFFTESTIKSIDNNVGFFRKSAAVAKKYQTQVQNKAIFFSIVSKAVEDNLPLPAFTLPSYALQNTDFSQIDFCVIDDITKQLRDTLNLGNGPISNMTLLIEKMGIRIHFDDLSSAKIDALTTFINGVPYIIINNDRTSSSRIRFNIAHELGHLLLHSNYSKSIMGNSSQNKRIESEANYFAGSLLLPEDGFSLDLSSTNMNHLLELKKHWKVSIQALIYRGEQIGLISSQQCLFLRQTISRNKWRLSEPFDDLIPIEYPTLLPKAFQFLENRSDSTIDKILKTSGLDFQYIRNMLDYQKKDNDDLIELPKLKLL